jgi:hypothetical protein
MSSINWGEDCNVDFSATINTSLVPNMNTPPEKQGSRFGLKAPPETAQPQKSKFRTTGSTQRPMELSRLSNNNNNNNKPTSGGNKIIPGSTISAKIQIHESSNDTNNIKVKKHDNDDLRKTTIPPATEIIFTRSCRNSPINNKSGRADLHSKTKLEITTEKSKIHNDSLQNLKPRDLSSRREPVINTFKISDPDKPVVKTYGRQPSETSRSSNSNNIIDKSQIKPSVQQHTRSASKKVAKEREIITISDDDEEEEDVIEYEVCN